MKMERAKTSYKLQATDQVYFNTELSIIENI